MDTSLERWISELEMDDYLIEQCPNFSNEFDEYVQLVSTPEDNFQQASSSESQSCGPTSSPSKASTTTTTATAKCGGSSVEICRTSFERPQRKLKMDNNSKAVITNDQANDNTGSSLEQNDEALTDRETNKELNGGNKNNIEPKAGQKRPNTMTRTPLEAQDRVMAERKRREKLSQRFIALSAMVPGLKKMDKASVLGDAIKYLKQLQENMKALEEKINKKSEESAVFVKKSHICCGDDTSSYDENFDGHFKESLPEIEARISEKTVLIRIHCEKHKGFAVKLLSEIEKLNLTVVNNSFLPFGNYAADITVIAEMEDDFNMTVKELVRSLRSAFMKCM